MDQGHMKNVEVIENGNQGWKVQLGEAELFVFRAQDEAEAFAERLRTRLTAPHDLPQVMVGEDQPA
jgi:hypothetical protein